MLFLSVAIDECCFLSNNKMVFESKYDTMTHYVNVIKYVKNIIDADYSVLLSNYILREDNKDYFYKKDFLNGEITVYYATRIREGSYDATYCYTYYIRNIKNLLKNTNNKNNFLNLLLEQYNYANTENWVDFVRVSLIIEKLSYVASIFTLRKYGYIPNKDDYCKLILFMEERGMDRHIPFLIMNILKVNFINKTYDNTTLFFLLRSLRNFLLSSIIDRDITNLEFIKEISRYFPFSTSEKIFDFNELKIYIQKSVNLNIYSLQRGHFKEYNFIRGIKEKLVYNYDENDGKKFAEATALLIAASITRLSKLKLIESIFVNVKGTFYEHNTFSIPGFRIQYTLESLRKKESIHSFESVKLIDFSSFLGYYYPTYFIFFNYYLKEFKMHTKELCKRRISYIRIDVYESKIRYGNKTLRFILPIIDYKCDSIPNSTGKIYDIKEIEDKLEEGFPIFTWNISDKENNKLDVSIVIINTRSSTELVVSEERSPIELKVYYRLSLVKKEQKVFRLDKFLAV